MGTSCVEFMSVFIRTVLVASAPGEIGACTSGEHLGSISEEALAKLRGCEGVAASPDLIFSVGLCQILLEIHRVERFHCQLLALSWVVRILRWQSIGD